MEQHATHATLQFSVTHDPEEVEQKLEFKYVGNIDTAITIANQLRPKTPEPDIDFAENEDIKVLYS